MNLRHRPTVRLGLLLTAVATLWAMTAPGVLATPPGRDVVYGSPIFIPAGEGCAFDVTVVPQPGAHARITYFADGRERWIAHGDATFTNVVTGATFQHRARFNATDVYIAATNQIRSMINGTVFIAFWPGDQGPFGEVGANGAMYRFTGHVEVVMEADTQVFTSFKSSGRVQDICAALS
jgi:hypothetical protein